MAQRDYEEFFELLNANGVRSWKEKANREQDKADLKHLRRAKSRKRNK